MAMVVKNNMAAVRTLNTLNSNSSALQKSLAKVSSGMKINSAQDDASGYAISERMRVQIRALDQANQNTQNGSSLMKTAEGAVASTIEILKTMKEKAINAATDTNTDDDRATIQKEINQFVDQIDDNALVTFNGKYLVEGSKVQSGEATYTALTNQSLAKDTTGETTLTELKNRKDEALGILATDRITASYVKDGRTYATTFTAGDTTLKGIFQQLENIDTDSQIFADYNNTSVTKSGYVPKTEEVEVGTTSTETKTTFERSDYETALNDLNTQKAEKQAAIEESQTKIGSIGVLAVTYDSTAKAYSLDTSKVSGKAAEIAELLVKAANLGELDSATDNDGDSSVTKWKVANYSTSGPDGTATTANGSAGSQNNSAAQTKVAVQLIANNNTTPTGGNLAPNEAATAGDEALAQAAPMINLTGKAVVLSSATQSDYVAGHVWDGKSLDADPTTTGNDGGVATAIENVIARLTSTDVHADKKEEAAEIAEKLKTALEEYSALNEGITDVNTELTTLNDNIGLVEKKVEEYDYLDNLETAKANVKDVIKAQLQQMAHPVSPDSDVSIATNKTMLNNGQYVGILTLTSTDKNDGGQLAAGAAEKGFISSRYDEDNEEIFDTIAEEIAEAIISNVEQFASSGDSDNKLSASTAITKMLNSLYVTNASDDSTVRTAANTPWTYGDTASNAGKFSTTNWEELYGVTANTVYTKADGSTETVAAGTTSALSLGQNSTLNWAAANGADIEAVGNLLDLSDDNSDVGYAKASDKYNERVFYFSDNSNANNKKLAKIMADYSTVEVDTRTTETQVVDSGPALLSGNAIGLNTSGEIVKTADETAGITVTANGQGLAGQIAGVTISVADATGNVKKSVNTALNAFKTSIFAANESKEDTSLKIHVGGAANQSLSVGMMDMRSQALGLKGADGSVISVATQDDANAAVAAFDNALAKALDQATTIGAIEARLEYTASNLTTSSENVQAAESTIRDADMAKEMTTYTKNNVLLQAAQSMLAQANQNASAVLSLLQ